MEEKPTEGKVFINGQDLTKIRRRKVPYLRRQMGVVFQDFRLIPTMTVYENVAFAMRVTNISTKKIKDRVPFALSLVGLEDKMDRLPDELSGGEQQRVAVARALAHGMSLYISSPASTATASSLWPTAWSRPTPHTPRPPAAMQPLWPSGKRTITTTMKTDL